MPSSYQSDSSLTFYFFGGEDRELLSLAEDVRCDEETVELLKKLDPTFDRRRLEGQLKRSWLKFQRAFHSKPMGLARVR